MRRLWCALLVAVLSLPALASAEVAIQAFSLASTFFHHTPLRVARLMAPSYFARGTFSSGEPLSAIACPPMCVGDALRIVATG